MKAKPKEETLRLEQALEALDRLQAYYHRAPDRSKGIGELRQRRIVQECIDRLLPWLQPEQVDLETVRDIVGAPGLRDILTDADADALGL
tara:strand:- start:400 stop:669 length:270 start_codon:yes stop_codon:yes gene_type:complete